MGSADGPVRVVPLGGLGEIGLNCLVLECAGAAIAIDCGVMFPDTSMLGIDLVIPEMEYLRQLGDALPRVRHHARARRPHRRAALCAARPRRPGVRDADGGGPDHHAAARARARPVDRPARLPPRRSLGAGSVRDRSDPRHPFDRRRRRFGDHDAARRRHPHRRLQDRLYPDRRPRPEHPGVCRVRRARRVAAALRLHQRRARRLDRLRAQRAAPASKGCSRAPRGASSSPPSRRTSIACSR